MRIETNHKLVRRRRNIARYLFFFSLAVLIGAFVFVNSQALDSEPTDSPEVALLLSALVLPFGVVTSMISVRMTNHWIRHPRPERALQEGLKGLSNRSVLYNYLHLPLRHLLICPQGVFAITTRFQNGSYRIDGDAWKAHEGWFSRVTRFFRHDGIGRPGAEARAHAARIQPYMPQGVEVQPLIVFVDPSATLDIHDSEVPVLYADSKQAPNIRDFLRAIPPEARQSLSPSQIEKFEAATLAG